MADVRVVHDPASLRYDLLRDGDRVGLIAYRDEPGVRVLAHTEVDPAHEGEGLGTALVEGALEQIRAEGLKVAPICPFVAAYVRRHREETQDLVAADPSTPE